MTKALLSISAIALATAATQAQLQLGVERVSTGAALFVCSPPGDTTRLFLVAQTGVITVVKNGVALPTAFLNLQGQISSGGEAGLLGVAFHPQFSQNGYCYVYYSTSTGVRIARYSLDPANPDRADPASAQQVLFITRGGGFHWGGWIGFGPDGFLYIASGNAGTGQNSQSLTTLLGKLLRLDVDHDDYPADPTRNYAIPLTNPLIASAVPEVWAFGVRNPWRCSFDRQTGDLWIGDVGDSRDEVDFQPAATTPFQARNYGYPCMEGSVCVSSIGCTCAQPGLIPPVTDYTVGSAVIGGYMYRGTRIADLQGWYLYADLSSGSRWRMRFTQSGLEGPLTVQISGLPTALHSFGEDANGELYACGPGGVFRIAALCPANCDNSIAPPVLNANDFQCFLNKFAAGDSYANCDGSTTPPVLTALDFGCYLNSFAAGCP